MIAGRFRQFAKVSTRLGAPPEVRPGQPDFAGMVITPPDTTGPAIAAGPVAPRAGQEVQFLPMYLRTFWKAIEPEALPLTIAWLMSARLLLCLIAFSSDL